MDEMDVTRDGSPFPSEETSSDADPSVAGASSSEELARQLFAQLTAEEAAGSSPATTTEPHDSSVGEADETRTDYGSPVSETHPDRDEATDDTPGDPTPLPQPQFVRVGDDVYEYDFVQTAVAEADKLAGLAEEVEAELEELRQTNQRLGELEYLLRAIQGRLGDPQFYAQLQALLEGRPVEQPAPPQERTDAFAEFEQERERERREQATEPPPAQLVEALVDQRLQAALVPLYAAYAKEAADRFTDDLEKRYNVKLSPEERAQVRSRAIDRGDFRSDHLFVAQVAQNPLEGAFFEVMGPKLVQGAQARKAQQEMLRRAPAKGRHTGQEGPPQPKSAELARQLISQLS